MTFEIQVMAWDRHTNVAELYQLLGSQPSCVLMLIELLWGVIVFVLLCVNVNWVIVRGDCVRFVVNTIIPHNNSININTQQNEHNHPSQ
jgi:hypothetical protein